MAYDGLGGTQDHQYVVTFWMCTSPSPNIDFSQSVDELVVFRRSGNRHLSQHLDLLCTTQEYQM